MVRKSTLENDIRVITERIPGAHSVTMGFWLQNGSRHEKASQNGISHFIEHMLFKGTKRRSALDIAKEIDSVGGVLNAFTGREYSCYYAKVLAEKLPLAIDLLSDIVLHSVFDPEEMEKERKVILQEIYMQEDAPDDKIHDLFIQNFWKDHPLGLTVLGTTETVRGISRDALLAFMEEGYRGNNVLICAAGNLEHQQIVDYIETAFSQVAPCSRRSICSLPRYQCRVNIVEKNLEQVHICLGTRALPQNHPDRFACYLLNTILGGGMSSRLFQKVRENRALAYSIYSYLICHSDAGALVVYSGTSPEEAPHVAGIILEELKRFKTELITEEELNSAKEQLKGQLLLSMESTDNRMTKLAKNEIYLGRNLALDELLGEFGRVTREKIRKVAEFILRDNHLNLQLVGKVREADFPMCRI
jgi:predicted Zn-dependent peptidase